MRIHSDDRRLGFFDLFPTRDGDVSLVRLHAGALSAWHRHQHQTDHFFCVEGSVKLGHTYNRYTEPEWVVLDAHYPRVVVVKPDRWHGYMDLSGGSILLLYATPKYNPEDEERRSIDDMGIVWERQPR